MSKFAKCQKEEITSRPVSECDLYSGPVVKCFRTDQMEDGLYCEKQTPRLLTSHNYQLHNTYAYSVCSSSAGPIESVCARPAVLWTEAMILSWRERCSAFSWPRPRTVTSKKTIRCAVLWAEAILSWRERKFLRLSWPGKRLFVPSRSSPNLTLTGQTDATRRCLHVKENCQLDNTDSYGSA